MIGKVTLREAAYPSCSKNVPALNPTESATMERVWDSAIVKNPQRLKGRDEGRVMTLRDDETDMFRCDLDDGGISISSTLYRFVIMGSGFRRPFFNFYDCLRCDRLGYQPECGHHHI